MSKLKIEHGASKLHWVLLKTNIEVSISTDIDLMCKWSDNDRRYVVNELLRFALTQSEDFQKYKAELQPGPPKVASPVRPVPVTANAAHDRPPKPGGLPAPTTSSR